MLDIGSKLPPVTLHTRQGEKTWQDFHRTNGLVIAFIHGTWCPFCLNQLVRLNLLIPELDSLEVGLICLTHNDSEEILSYEWGLGLPLRYQLLPDLHPSLSHQFGVYDPEHDSPYPALFYSDAEDLIRYRDVSSDPDCYPDHETLLSSLR